MDENALQTIVVERDGCNLPGAVTRLVAASGDVHIVLSSTDRAAAIELALPSIGALRIRLVGYGPRDLVPANLLDALVSREVREVERVLVDESVSIVRTVPHRPLEGFASTTLMIAPRAVVPALNGARRRVFGNLLQLRDDGCAADLVLVGTNRDLALPAPLLQQVCPRVIFVKRGKAIWPANTLLTYGIDRTRAYFSSDATRAPRFEERWHTYAQGTVRNSIERLVSNGGYATIIVNYAWMLGVVSDKAMQTRQLVVDTHDVQHARHASSQTPTGRRGDRKEREMALEIQALSNCGLILAISENDAQTFASMLGEDAPIQLLRPDFSYAIQDTRRPQSTPETFGFVGSNMIGNVRALEIIRKDWWPTLSRSYPNARLRIAGTICDSPIAKGFAGEVDTVERLGVVPSLSTFYATTDVLLNPAVVRGGLLYKNVEAAVAGSLVVTTPLGAAAWGPFECGVVVPPDGDLTRLIAEAWPNTNVYTTRARGLHSGGPRLSTRLGTTIPESSHRVLLQVGDIHENFERCLPLAKQLVRRGYQPIFLVYARENRTYFWLRGFDAVSLNDYDVTLAQLPKLGRDCVTTLLTGRAGHACDLTDALRTEFARGEASAGHLLGICRNRLRVEGLLADIGPYSVGIWNGYTGHVANLLRLAAPQHGSKVFYLERSHLAGHVFVDPFGVNGFSLCRQQVLVNTTHSSFSDRRATLDRPSSKILVPLQVAGDTNLVLHGHGYTRPCQLVAEARKLFPQSQLIVRRHPEERPDRQPPDDAFREYSAYISTGASLAEDLEEADAVVTVNSTVGLEALVAGVPVIALGAATYTNKGVTALQIDPVGAQLLTQMLGVAHVTQGDPLPTSLEPMFPPRDGRAEHSARAKEVYAALSRLLALGPPAKLTLPARLPRFGLTYRTNAVEPSEPWLLEQLTQAWSTVGLDLAELPIERGGEEMVLHLGIRSVALDKHGCPAALAPPPSSDWLRVGLAGLERRLTAPRLEPR